MKVKYIGPSYSMLRKDENYKMTDTAVTHVDYIALHNERGGISVINRDQVGMP